MIPDEDTGCWLLFVDEFFMGYVSSVVEGFTLADAIRYELAVLQEIDDDDY